MQVDFIHYLLSTPATARLPVNSALGYRLQSTHLSEMNDKCWGCELDQLSRRKA